MRGPLKKMMDYCTYCPKMCRFSCPVSEVTKEETTTPWGKMQLAGWFLNRQIPFSRENALPLYQCSNCLACQEYCEHLNDVPEALAEVRRMSAENWAAPDRAYAVGENFARSNNPYGVDPYRDNRVPHKAHWRNKKIDVLFFPSCHTLHFFPARLQVYFDLFKKLNIPKISIHHSTLHCCGEPLRALGFRNQFHELSEAQSQTLKNNSLIVSDDAECVHSFKTHYPWGGLLNPGPQALHLLEFLEPFFFHSSYRTRGKVKGRVVVQDPPFLARHLKQAGLPGRLLTQVTGFPPIRLLNHGKDTLSTGTDGSYDLIFPELAEKMGNRLVSELRRRGFKKLLTVSTKEEVQLRNLAPDLEVQDIFEFFNEQIL